MDGMDEALDDDSLLEAAVKVATAFWWSDCAVQRQRRPMRGIALGLICRGRGASQLVFAASAEEAIAALACAVDAAARDARVVARLKVEDRRLHAWSVAYGQLRVDE